MKKTAFLFLLFTVATQAFSQKVAGIIADSTNKSPVAFAHITLNDRKTGTISDIDGRFSFSLPSGYAGVVYITHINYQPLQLTANEFRRLSVLLLKPKITQLNCLCRGRARPLTKIRCCRLEKRRAKNFR